MSPTPTDWEGRRIQGDKVNTLYLVVDGTLRAIANPNVYESLYGNQDFQYDKNAQELVDKFPKGPTLDQQPSLIKGTNDGVFLIDEGQKRPIKSMEVFNRYGFSEKNIVRIGTLAALIPDGPYLPG